MNKLPLTDIHKQLNGGEYVLMLGLGFDSRCLEVLKHFSKSKASHIVGISNAGWSDFNRNSIEEFKSYIGNAGIVLGTNAKDVIAVADEVSAYIQPLLLENNQSILIDVTAISHELLAVLLGIMHNLKVLGQVTLLYVGATEYSFNSTSEESMWLSRGVKTIRSMLGFPGTMLPSKKLHLIVLAGFEVERASEVIIQYEPASLSIGLGKREQSISTAHHEKNKYFFDKLNDFVKQQQSGNEGIHHFDFSCIDPLHTRNVLLAHIDQITALHDRNFVVCPLNTKLSTVGVILAALERPSIQICYAEPIEYNTDGYARAGNDVTIVEMANINQDI